MRNRATIFSSLRQRLNEADGSRHALPTGEDAERDFEHNHRPWHGQPLPRAFARIPMEYYAAVVKLYDEEIERTSDPQHLEKLSRMLKLYRGAQYDAPRLKDIVTNAVNATISEIKKDPKYKDMRRAILRRTVHDRAFKELNITYDVSSIDISKEECQSNIEILSNANKELDDMRKAAKVPTVDEFVADVHERGLDTALRSINFEVTHVIQVHQDLVLVQHLIKVYEGLIKTAKPQSEVDAMRRKAARR